MNKIKHAGVAAETLRICNTGGYVATDTRRAQYIAPYVEAAVRETVLYRPGWLYCDDKEVLPQIEVTNESTMHAAWRLSMPYNARVALLNFASAKQPGGGFLSGTSAQEEDLCRCSALYPCLLTQLEFYEQNRALGGLYTDHIIYSPDVPFFRDDGLRLIDTPFTASVITAPAPNCKEIPSDARDVIQDVLRRRARMILGVAADRGHKTLILGAWGCGAFKNDPHMVANVFADLLLSSEYGFELVIFAILDATEKQETLRAFQSRLGGK